MAGSGGQGKRPRESIDQAGRAVDLLCLDATPEESIQRSRTRSLLSTPVSAERRAALRT
jgi:hypothetical protein